MSDLQLTHNLTADNQQLEITVAGRLAIDTVSSLHALLLNQMPAAGKILLDMSHVEQLDLSGMQLICSACQSATDQEKPFNFTKALPDEIKKAVSDSGLHRMATCIHNASQTCIWCGGLN